jgi:hypothetical protein
VRIQQEEGTSLNLPSKLETEAVRIHFGSSIGLVGAYVEQGCLFFGVFP